MQFLNPVDPNKSSASLVRTSAPSLHYDSKPISADDIRKAKQREKLGLPASTNAKTPEELKKPSSEKTRDDTPQVLSTSSLSLTTPITEVHLPLTNTIISTKKRVRWAPDDRLVALRTFKKEKVIGMTLLGQQ